MLKIGGRYSHDPSTVVSWPLQGPLVLGLMEPRNQLFHLDSWGTWWRMRGLDYERS